jgi:2'-5' RNA ligase
MEQAFFRTFIALPVRAGKEFLQLTEGLKQALSDERISWVRPENYHFTLRFLGNTPPDQVVKIGEALRTGVQSSAFRLRMTRPSSFGPRQRPRVLYVGVLPSPELEKVQIRVEQIMKECGWPPSDQPFRAHLTLGRVRSLNNLAAYEDALHRYGTTDPGTLIVDRLVYFRSILGSGGPVYSKITAVEFS